MLRRHFVFFFAAVSAGALAGAISHGFFPETTSAGVVLWRATMLLIGLAGVASFLVATALVFGERFASAFGGVGVLAFLGYALFVVFVRFDFQVALLFYVPLAVLLLLAFIVIASRSENAGTLGAVGVLLTFVAAWVQAAEVALDPVLFDHNATYHVVQAIGLLLIYVAGRKLLGGGEGRQQSR